MGVPKPFWETIESQPSLLPWILACALTSGRTAVSPLATAQCAAGKCTTVSTMRPSGIVMASSTIESSESPQHGSYEVYLYFSQDHSPVAGLLAARPSRYPLGRGALAEPL